MSSNLRLTTKNSSSHTVQFDLNKNQNVCDGMVSFSHSSIEIPGITIYTSYKDFMGDTIKTPINKSKIPSQYREIDIIFNYNGEIPKRCHIVDDIQIWATIDCSSSQDVSSVVISETYTLELKSYEEGVSNPQPHILHLKENFNQLGEEDSIEIYWREVPNACKYNVRWSKKKTQFSETKKIEVESRDFCQNYYIYENPNLESNEIYFFKVEALDCMDNIISISPLLKYKTCQYDCYGEDLNLCLFIDSPQFYDYDILNGNGYTVIIPFAMANLNISEYRLRYRINGSSDWIEHEESPIDECDIPYYIEMSNLVPDSVYDFQIIAKCTTGEYFLGPIETVIVPPIPEDIINMDFIYTVPCHEIDSNSISYAIHKNKITLSWAEQENVERYIIEYKEESKDTYEKAIAYTNEITLTKYFGLPLKGNTTYDIRIQLDCGYNYSAYSHTIKATTGECNNYTGRVIECLAPEFNIYPDTENSIIVNLLNFESEVDEYTVRWRADGSENWNYVRLRDKQTRINNLAIGRLYEVSVNRRCFDMGSILSEWSNSQFVMTNQSECVLPRNVQHSTDDNNLYLFWSENDNFKVKVNFIVILDNDDVINVVERREFVTTIEFALENNYKAIKYELATECDNGITSGSYISDWIVLKDISTLPCNAPVINKFEIGEIKNSTEKAYYKVNLQTIITKNDYEYYIEGFDKNGSKLLVGNVRTLVAENGKDFIVEGPYINNYHSRIKNAKLYVRTVCNSQTSSEWEDVTITNPDFNDTPQADVCNPPSLELEIRNDGQSIYWDIDPVEGAIAYETQYRVKNAGEWTTLGTNQLIGGIVPGNVYEFRTRSICINNNISVWSREEIGAPGDVLTCSNVLVNYDSYSEKIRVNWTWEREHYKVHLILNNENGVEVEEVSLINPDGNTYTFEGLKSSSTYELHVASICDNGLVTNQPPITIKTMDLVVDCPTLTMFEYQIINTNSLNFNWTLDSPQNPDDIATFSLEWTYKGKTYQQNIDKDLREYTLSELPLDVNIDATLTVVCLNSGPSSSESINGIVIPNLTCSNADINPIANEISDSNGGEILISWNNANDDIFIIKWHPSGNPNNAMEIETGGNSYLFTGLVPNQLYDLEVIKKCDEGVLSTPLELNNVRATAVPVFECAYTIDSLALLSRGHDFIELTWNVESSMIKEIELRYSEVKASGWEWETIVLPSTMMTYKIQNLKEDTKYRFELSSVCNNDAVSVPSIIDEMTDKKECYIGENLTIYIQGNSIVIEWSKMSNNNRYKVLYKFENDADWTVKNIVGNNYKMPSANLHKGKKIYVKVQALGKCCDPGYDWYEEGEYIIP